MLQLSSLSSLEWLNTIILNENQKSTIFYPVRVLIEISDSTRVEHNRELHLQSIPFVLYSLKCLMSAKYIVWNNRIVPMKDC